MKHKAEPTIACVSDPAGERTLVVAAKNGDEQAFETLFKRYQRKILAVVLRYTRVVEDAEDIVQQSFYKAFVHLCQFQGESSFSTWLTRIAINEALMFLRHIRALREVSIDSISDAEGSPASLEDTRLKCRPGNPLLAARGSADSVEGGSEFAPGAAHSNRVERTS